MTKPIPDNAEITLEFPEEFHVGTFEKSSRFAAWFDADDVALIFDRPGPREVRRSAHLYIRQVLFADILGELARSVPELPPGDIGHRDALREAARELYEALAPSDLDDASPMTEDEQELILRIME
jgi:hypothetical protein